MRGAGDSFGIAVNFYLQTKPLPPVVVKFELDLSEVAGNVTKAVAAFMAIQNYAKNSTYTDRRLGLSVSLGSDHFIIDGMWIGTLGIFKAEYLPGLLDTLPVHAVQDVIELDWMNCMDLLGDWGTLEIPKDYSDHQTFFAKSVTIPDPGVDEASVKHYFEFLFSKGAEMPVEYYSMWDLYGGFDSQIAEKGRLKPSAFGHRDAFWVVQNYGYVTGDKAFPHAGIKAIEELNDACAKNLPGCGAYNGYTDPSLDRERANVLYFGPSIYGRLKSLKARLDPYSLFSNPQSI
ncbi:hypothetical protein F4780DRAFT_749290 [Xylariomycetidae sp. FL0641]|nr:hypothetical protein F4780DRAFT_749290 [Xylariomycetidae sp. FL0641]